MNWPFLVSECARASRRQAAACLRRMPIVDCVGLGKVGAWGLPGQACAKLWVPLLNVQQRPVIIREIAGVQDLDTCVVVAVEGGDSAGAASLNRVGGVGKPDSEMVGLDRGWTRIKNEGLIVQDTGNVENSSSFSIGCQVALVPSWDKRRIGGGDYKEGEVGIRRKFEGFHVHVLHRTEIADGDPPARTGI